MPQAVATRYARALADAALDQKNRLDPQQALRELATFAQMMNDSADLRNILLSPAVQSSRKRAVIAKFADTLPLSRLVRNLLYVTVDHHRIGIVGEIRDAFEAVLDERLGLVRAEVQSAIPLDASEQQAVQGELSRLAGKQVRCTFDIEPSLIGGVKARIGSTIYDGSVRARLDALRERLVARR